jgi:hypothetical protein
VQELIARQLERPIFGVVVRVDDSEHETMQDTGIVLPEMSTKSNSTSFGSGDFRATIRGRLPASQ